MSARIFVGNLNYSTTAAELRGLASEVGPVASVHIPTDRETGRPRGFAFVEFEDELTAEVAIRQLHGRELGGRRLAVEAATKRPARPAPEAAPPRGDRHRERELLEPEPAFDEDAERSGRSRESRREHRAFRELRGTKRRL